MLFKLTNTAVSFPKMMYAIFKDIERCIWYLDDILIYSSNTKAQHQHIFKKRLLQGVGHKLAIILLKNEFYVHKSIIVVYVINGH